MRDGFKALVRAPFRALVATGIFVSLVSNTLPEGGDEWTLVAALLLISLSLYLQMAIVLAAAEPDVATSADIWLKEAFGRRCFLRYLATSFLVVFSVLVAGVLGLVIGAFLMGAVVALADTAVVLERRRPIDAIRRSAELGRNNRRSLMVIFGLLILIPGLTVQLGDLAWDLRAAAGPLWPLVPVLVLVLGAAAGVALTRIFVTLGGQKIPVEERPGSPPR
jgi:hypothetical protein